MFGEAMDKAFTDAIVQQFFQGSESFTDANGIFHPARPAPLTIVVNDMLSKNQSELLQAIVDAIDTDVLVDKIAERVIETLSKKPNESIYHSATAEERIVKKVQGDIHARFVELMAQKMFDDMQKVED